MNGSGEMRDSALWCDDVRLGYGGQPVVHGSSLKLSRGSVMALVGPNGSGKSTLLRALARLHQVDSGEIGLDGRPSRVSQPYFLYLLKKSRPD